ncbi:MAG: hypothetical protein ACW963_09615 [Candidatus Sifarchaeia archaeon]|jgi:excinuclease UvrABC nuclease subunit
MGGKKRKTVGFNKEGIGNLLNNKPAVYKIMNRKGENIYTGSAKRGRVKERLSEHFPGGPDRIPGGAKVQVQQKGRIAEAQKSEMNIISRSKPKYNKKGK